MVYSSKLEGPLLWCTGASIRVSVLLLLSVLHLSSVHPHLEYVSEVWSPHLQRDINKMEAVQKLALKICVNNCMEGYNSLMSQLKATSLTTRREHRRMVTLFEYLNGYYYIPDGVLPLSGATQLHDTSRWSTFILPCARHNQ